MQCRSREGSSKQRTGESYSIWDGVGCVSLMRGEMRLLPFFASNLQKGVNGAIRLP
jgi:hypothetical protein